MNGWFAVKRGITRHPLFEGRPERLAIWIWLLDNAAWKDTPHDIGGKTVTIPRGSIAVSERRIAQEVGVGRQVVRTFLDRLIAEHMIDPDLTHGRRIIRICNYEKYQTWPDKGNPPPKPAPTHDQPIKEQGNNYSNPYGSGAKAPTDPAKAIFDQGLALLVEAGVPAKRARSILGKWRSLYDDPAVIAALGRAQREGAIDPVAFIEGVLRKSASSGPKQTDDGRVVYADAFGGGPVYR